MSQIIVRSATQHDFLSVYEFVCSCPPLEKYFEHFYKIILRYFGNTCFIAEADGRIVGFILGFISQTQKNTIFLWQIGVDSSYRGQGISHLLLDAVEQSSRQCGCTRIELTVDPKNIQSIKFFENRGYQNISRNEGDVVEVCGHFAIKDYYKPDRHFILFEKNYE